MDRSQHPVIKHPFGQFKYPTVPLHVASPQVRDASALIGSALWGTE
jgi:hypothetical protein